MDIKRRPPPVEVYRYYIEADEKEIKVLRRVCEAYSDDVQYDSAYRLIARSMKFIIEKALRGEF